MRRQPSHLVICRSIQVLASADIVFQSIRSICPGLQIVRDQAAIHSAGGCNQSANARESGEACYGATGAEWCICAGSTCCTRRYGLQKDIDDLRESPALDVFRLLSVAGADVVFTDPMVPVFRKDDGTVLHASPAVPELWTGADLVIITTDHSGFDYQEMADHAKLIFDTRNATAGCHGEILWYWVSLYGMRPREFTSNRNQ